MLGGERPHCDPSCENSSPVTHCTSTSLSFAASSEQLAMVPAAVASAAISILSINNVYIMK